MDDVTQLLAGVRDGDPAARDRLLPIVYDQLRAMAHRRISSSGTLVTTELVHETYLKLFERATLDVECRRHFFSVAAIAMRQVLIDRARARGRQKRGGDLQRVDLENSEIPSNGPAEEILSLDAALRRLELVSERLARVVELRFFGGLSVEETAEVLNVDPRTVKRDWRKAKAVLHRELTQAPE